MARAVAVVHGPLSKGCPVKGIALLVIAIVIVLLGSADTLPDKDMLVRYRNACVADRKGSSVLNEVGGRL